MEALLLLTEWHPRALAFPQFSNCGDACEKPMFEDNKTREHYDSTGSSGTRWREELFEPAKRADRMSWMMLGIALSLAHELGVYDESQVDPSNSDNSVAKQRLRRLLYLNVNQLALTLGCTSFLPPGLSNSSLSSSITTTVDAFGEGEKLISLWIDLTSLLKMAKGLSFSNRSSLRAGAYDGLLDHLQPLLSQWFHQFQSFKPVSKYFLAIEEGCKTLTTKTEASPAAVDLLFVDYQYVRMYVGSVGIQALVKSVDSSNNRKLTVYELLCLGNQSDFKFTKDVIDASRSILSKTVSFARSGVLRFCPARVFFRITSACVFLLKALGLGALHRELSESLNLLDQCTEALASLASDGDQPWGNYAILIKRYARQFRRKIEPAAARSPAEAPASNTRGPPVPTEAEMLSTDTICELQIFG